jgi:hypothetical protein
MRLRIECCALLTLPYWPAESQTRPLIDYHQHLFRAATVTLISPKPPAASGAPINAISATDLVGLLDAAGIRRALVLPAAYTWGSPSSSRSPTRSRRTYGGEPAAETAFVGGDWSHGQQMTCVTQRYISANHAVNRRRCDVGNVLCTRAPRMRRT